MPSDPISPPPVRGGGLHLPVIIMAGSDDQVVDVGRHAIRLRQQIAHSELQLVPAAGHMVHHAVPGQVAETVQAITSAQYSSGKNSDLAA